MQPDGVKIAKTLGLQKRVCVKNSVSFCNKAKLCIIGCNNIFNIYTKYKALFVDVV